MLLAPDVGASVRLLSLLGVPPLRGSAPRYGYAARCAVSEFRSLALAEYPTNLNLLKRGFYQNAVEVSMAYRIFETHVK